ncbi:MAG: isoprenylcysteine carboxylmethyltransferase family protein [Candidatus Neomarinimicrobiota bacterium]
MGVEPIAVAVTIAIWALLLYLQRSLPLPVMRLSPGWRWGLSLLFLADGLGTLLWSAFTLAKANRGNKLADTGPYALVRHPMYGTVLWSGTAVVAFAFHSWLVLPGVVPLHLCWIWLVQHEEQELIRRFGAAYIQYAQETGQFLPRLTSLKKVAQGTDDLES